MPGLPLGAASVLRLALAFAPARMGLAAAGASELIAEDLEGYRRIALDLARDASLREAVERRLRQATARAPLFDLARFGRHLEQAYARMWRHYLGGRAPEAIEILPIVEVGA